MNYPIVLLTIHEYNQMRDRWPNEPILDHQNGVDLYVSTRFNGPLRRPSEIERDRATQEPGGKR